MMDDGKKEKSGRRVYETKGELILLSEDISNIIIHGMELEYIDLILK